MTDMEKLQDLIITFQHSVLDSNNNVEVEKPVINIVVERLKELRELKRMVD